MIRDRRLSPPDGGRKKSLPDMALFESNSTCGHMYVLCQATDNQHQMTKAAEILIFNLGTIDTVLSNWTILVCISQ